MPQNSKSQNNAPLSCAPTKLDESDPQRRLETLSDQGDQPDQHSQPNQAGDIPAPLCWEHRIKELGPGGRDTFTPRQRKADDDERARLTEALAVSSCHSLVADYKLRGLHKGRILLSGQFDCQVEQACVVTLVPVANTIKEQFEVEFWPESQIERAGDDITINADELAERDIEAILDDRIDVGRIVYETVVSALDPYPRAPGVEFQDATADATKGDAVDDGKSEHPFAALAGLKGAKPNE